MSPEDEDLCEERVSQACRMLLALAWELERLYPEETNSRAPKVKKVKDMTTRIYDILRPPQISKVENLNP